METVKSFMWPFRRANDDIFQQTATNKESVYDTLGSLPKNNYKTEMRYYIEGKWRRGFIQSVLPSGLAGACAGFLVGLQQVTYRNRHDPRAKVIMMNTVGFAALGVGVSGMHHFMIVRNSYNDNYFFPVAAGISGSSMFAMSQGQTLASGGVAGLGVGIAYFLACYASRYFSEKRLNNFLATQQSQETPVHKVAPELQPLYRSYLYEFRPIEESPELRRRARLYARDENDFRVDSYSMFEALTPEWYHWISFPEWWIMKTSFGAVEEQTMLQARRKDDEFTRRYTGFIRDGDGAMLKNIWRTKDHVQTGIGKFELPHEREERLGKR